MGKINAKWERIKAKRPQWESKIDMSREGEKMSFSRGGGAINIVFGPKYRPLAFYSIC